MMATFSASTSEAQAQTLQSRLTAAKHQLHVARVIRTRAQARLKAAIAARVRFAKLPTPSPAPRPSLTPTPIANTTPKSPTVARIKALRRAVVKAKVRVRNWTELVASLRSALSYESRLEQWEATHNWKPLVSTLAKRWNVNPTSLLRMMNYESGGRPKAVSGGTFFGLFQYCPSTWHSSWNPWRNHSIFDARAQICATALAIKRGYGPKMWPNTYPLAF
jgi:soluble lytic murein transglycosylase-like protein